MSARLVVTGWSVFLPDADDSSPLLLGRKGLLYKEPATRLALCAVHRALRLPDGRRPDSPMCPRTAVVACSNLGNVATVAKVARTVAAEGGRAVSVLDAPNVSSNVVASSVALWFRFGGPNLMVCSGAGAGHDALRLAALLLRAGRADRVVVVGAEPADEVAMALHSGVTDRPLRAGAACVVLRAWAPDAPGSAGQAVVELASGTGSPGVTLDPAAQWGDCYGAQGVIELALAAQLATGESHGAVGVRGALVGAAESMTAGSRR